MSRMASAARSNAAPRARLASEPLATPSFEKGGSLKQSATMSLIQLHYIVVITGVVFTKEPGSTPLALARA